MSPQRCPGQDSRYWKGESVFEINCPHCGSPIEFFKDESARSCPSCRRKVRNTKLDLGCAKWCAFAAECLGQLPDDEGDKSRDKKVSLCDRIIDRMKATFGGDQPRIDHAMSVLDYAEQIMGDAADVSGLVVRAAAVLHDIGIVEAEKIHGSAAGKWQELEGPPIARRILTELEVDRAVIDHVCRIVANHHSARDIDTPEFRIIWDADWLVNIATTYDTTDTAKMARLIDRIFRTDEGKRIAKSIFLENIKNLERKDT